MTLWFYSKQTAFEDMVEFCRKQCILGDCSSMSIKSHIQRNLWISSLQIDGEIPNGLKNCQ